MKKIVLSIALLTALCGTAQAQITTTKTTAPVTSLQPTAGERSEWLTSFTSAIVAGPFDITFVRVAESQAPKIVYDTKGSYTTRFKAEVKDKVLRITERADSRRPERTSVTVYYNELQSVSVSDATARFEGTISQPMFDLTVGGTASVIAALTVKDLVMDLSGRSSSTLSGNVTYLTLMVSTGKVDASKLDVTSAEVNATNSGSASLWINDRFEGKTSTGGKITYKGKPAVVRGSLKFMGGDITHLD